MTDVSNTSHVRSEILYRERSLYMAGGREEGTEVHTQGGQRLYMSVSQVTAARQWVILFLFLRGICISFQIKLKKNIK